MTHTMEAVERLAAQRDAAGCMCAKVLLDGHVEAATRWAVVHEVLAEQTWGALVEAVALVLSDADEAADAG